MERELKPPSLESMASLEAQMSLRIDCLGGIIGRIESYSQHQEFPAQVNATIDLHRLKRDMVSDRAGVRFFVPDDQSTEAAITNVGKVLKAKAKPLRGGVDSPPIRIAPEEP